MAETLETGDLPAPPRIVPALPPVVLPPYLAPAKTRFKGLPASISNALDNRRLVLLLPFAMIVGLVACVELPFDPHPAALAAGTAAIGLTMVLSLQAPVRLRLPPIHLPAPES